MCLCKKKRLLLFGSQNYIKLWRKIICQLTAGISDLFLIKRIKNLLPLSP